MKQLRLWLPALLALMLLFSVLPISAAEEVPMPSVSEASAVILHHVDSENTVVSENADRVLSAGSMPKVLAGLLICEAMQERLHEEIEITKPMLQGSMGFCLGLSAGDVLAVEELLYAALCGSYNDAYDVLAYVVGGSKSDFLLQMNDRAAALGATDTHFTDVSGVDDASVTTATDMLKIAAAAIQNELYFSLADTKKYDFDGSFQLPAKTIYNRNALLASNITTKYYNELCHGLSAGQTKNGGCCVATLFDNGKERYLCIVLGGMEDTDGKNYGYTVADRLASWVYRAYAYTDVITPETVVCTIPVTVSDLTQEVEVRTDRALSVYLPLGCEVGKEITYSVRLIHTSLEAPVEEGMMVGYVAVLYNGENIGTLPLYTAAAAERSSFMGSLRAMQALTSNRIFIAGASFFAVGMITWITVECVLQRRRRHKWDKYFSQKMTPSADALISTEKKTSPQERSRRDGYGK